MKILFIGGTGQISTAVTELLLAQNADLTLLNRGSGASYESMGAKHIRVDISDAMAVNKALGSLSFDVVVDWIAFTKEQVQRDIDLFASRTSQYIFISSASAYEKPARHYIITESTPLSNPYWQYSRDKISCEHLLEETYQKNGFPYTVVRPSHTYGQGNLPILFWRTNYIWTFFDRMLRGKPMIVHGDGTSLWTITHNTDFAIAFIGLMGQPKAIRQCYHITSDEALTWNNIHHTIARALGVEANIVHIPSEYIVRQLPEYEGDLIGDKTESVIFDNSKIKNIVPGWNACVSFAEGARMAVNWHHNHPESKKIDEEYNQKLDDLANSYNVLMNSSLK